MLNYASDHRELQRKLMSAAIQILRESDVAPGPGTGDLFESLQMLALYLCDLIQERKDGCSVQLLAAAEAVSAVAEYQELRTRQATPQELVMAGAALGRAEVALWLAQNKGLEKADERERHANARRGANQKKAAGQQALKQRAFAEARRWQSDTGETKAQPVIAHLEGWLRTQGQKRSWSCLERWVSELRKG